MPLEPTPERMLAVIDGRIGWLTTLREDGSPHVTPVWYALRDGSFWIATARRNRKVRNVLADPRAVIAVDGTAASGPLVVEGTVTVHDVDEPGVAEALAEKYGGWDAADAEVDGERVLLRFRVRRWLLAR